MCITFVGCYGIVNSRHRNYLALNHALFWVFFHLSLGDIGGQVGLFLGASILTVLEFGDLVARIIVNKIKQRKRRRARTV